MSSTKLKSAVDIGATVLVAVAACVVIVRQFVPSNAPPAGVPQPPAIQGKVIEAKKIRHSLGTAKVALVEFSDYECPFCAKYTRETAPRVRKELVDAGVVRMVQFHFPLRKHATAEMAAVAAECAGRQGRYWEMHDALFSVGGPIADEDVLRLISPIGVDRTTFTACRSGDAAADVASDVAMARSLGVRATPTFMVGMMTEDGSVRLLKFLGSRISVDEIRTIATDVQAAKAARRF